MTDIDKHIDEIMGLEAKIENCISGTGSAQDYDYLLNVRATKAPEMVSIIRELQAQVVERGRVIGELANLSGQLHALVTCTELSESSRVYEANIVQSQIKALINKAGE